MYHVRMDLEVRLSDKIEDAQFNLKLFVSLLAILVTKVFQNVLPRYRDLFILSFSLKGESIYLF